MKEAGELEVHVDNDIAVQNLNRMAAKFGCKMRSEKQDEKHYVVTLDVVNPVAESAAEEEEIVCAPNALALSWWLWTAASWAGAATSWARR